MSNAIVTICNRDYGPLLDLWISSLRPLTSLPLYVLTINDFVPVTRSNIIVLPINPSGNPFPPHLPDHVCAEKLRLFEHLPPEISRVLFLDVDVWVLHPFWNIDGCFGGSRSELVMCPDLFVGYKERMNDEFQPYDPGFQMRFNSDGSYCYYNTGVFFASRRTHAQWFSRFLETWRDYVIRMARYPSIFDQNIFNYCLIRYSIEVQPLSVLNNCLRQYEPQIESLRLLTLNAQPVNAYHFNGGDARMKHARWLEMRARLEETR